MEENEQNIGISHIFDTNKTYYLNGNEYNGKMYYNVIIKKKNYDGTYLEGPFQVQFKKGLDIPPIGTKIKIKHAMEDWYFKNNNRFHIVMKLMIMDYEIVQQNYDAMENALDAYNSTNYDESDLPF